MKKNVIVSLADANYYPLLNELVDSIKQFQQSENVAICILDAGLETKQKEALIKRFEPSSYLNEFTDGVRNQAKDAVRRGIFWSMFTQNNDFQEQRIIDRRRSLKFHFGNAFQAYLNRSWDRDLALKYHFKSLNSDFSVLFDTYEAVSSLFFSRGDFYASYKLSKSKVKLLKF